MKPQDLTALANKVSSFISDLDMDDVRDDLLARANLQRRRPVMMSASAVGLITLGAVAAFATVAFVPQVRSFFISNDGDDLTKKAEKLGSKAKDAAKDVADELTDDAKQAASKVMHNNGSRTHNRA